MSQKLTPAVGPPNPNTGAPTGDDPYLPTDGNGGYTVTGYDLDLDYRAGTERLEGTAIITAMATHKLSRFSLDLVGLVASKVSVNGTRVAKFSQMDGTLSIRPATPLPDGTPFTVMVRYGGFPHPTTSPFDGSATGWNSTGQTIYVTGVPNGAPTWFPCNNLIRGTAPVRIRLSCDARCDVVATGALQSQKKQGDRTTWLFSTDEPVAPHQVGLVLGTFELVDGQVEPHTVSRIEGVLEQAFGPRPVAALSMVVTADDLPAPLCAHGVIVFSTAQIAPQRAGQAAEGDAAAAHSLIAGTLARQWFGASATVESWRHAWLQEACAVYARWLWSEAEGARQPAPTAGGVRPIAYRSAHEHARHHWQVLAHQPQDIVVADPGPLSVFDERVAIRGALALQALRETMGDSEFFGVMRGFTQQRRHGTASLEQFVDAAASTPAVRDLLHRWLEEKPLPAMPHG